MPMTATPGPAAVRSVRRILARFRTAPGMLDSTQRATLPRLGWKMHEFGSFAPMSIVTRETRPRCARRNLTAAASWDPAG